MAANSRVAEYVTSDAVDAAEIIPASGLVSRFNVNSIAHGIDALLAYAVLVVSDEAAAAVAGVANEETVMSAVEISADDIWPVELDESVEVAEQATVVEGSAESLLSVVEAADGYAIPGIVSAADYYPVVDVATEVDSDVEAGIITLASEPEAIEPALNVAEQVESENSREIAVQKDPATQLSDALEAITGAEVVTADTQQSWTADQDVEPSPINETVALDISEFVVSPIAEQIAHEEVAQEKVAQQIESDSLVEQTVQIETLVYEQHTPVADDYAVEIADTQNSQNLMNEPPLLLADVQHDVADVPTLVEVFDDSVQAGHVTTVEEIRVTSADAQDWQATETLLALQESPIIETTEFAAECAVMLHAVDEQVEPSNVVLPINEADLSGLVLNTESEVVTDQNTIGWQNATVEELHVTEIDALDEEYQVAQEHVVQEQVAQEVAQLIEQHAALEVAGSAALVDESGDVQIDDSAVVVAEVEGWVEHDLQLAALQVQAAQEAPNEFAAQQEQVNLLEVASEPEQGSCETSGNGGSGDRVDTGDRVEPETSAPQDVYNNNVETPDSFEPRLEIFAAVSNEQSREFPTDVLPEEAVKAELSYAVEHVDEVLLAPDAIGHATDTDVLSPVEDQNAAEIAQSTLQEPLEEITQLLGEQTVDQSSHELVLEALHEISRVEAIETRQDFTHETAHGNVEEASIENSQAVAEVVEQESVLENEIEQITKETQEDGALIDSEKPLEESTVPVSLVDKSDSLADVLEAEFRNKLACIRQYLDGSVSVDADGETITSTSYLIPVHTLYGNCKVAELEQLGAVVGRLEKLLQDHPYRIVSPVLQAVLAGFCDITEKVLENPGMDSRFTPSAELQHKLDAFSLALDHVRAEISGASAPGIAATHNDTAPAEMASVSDDGRNGVDPETLVLEGFLQEARTIHAHIQNLYAAFCQGKVYDRNQAGRLRDQFLLFEGAASLAGQKSIAPVCRELARAYQQYVEGLFAVNTTVIILLDSCHAHIDACMNSYKTSQRVETCADDLQTELRLAIQQIISLRKEADTQVAEEKVEDSLLAVFIEEAGEILHEMDSKIADWQQAPDDKSILDDLLRSLHTLKGSAALVGEKEMSESAHIFESVIIDSGRTRRVRDAQFFAEVDRHLNVLQVLFGLYQTDESGRFVRAAVNEEEMAQLMHAETAQKPVNEVATAVSWQPESHSAPVVLDTTAQHAAQVNAANAVENRSVANANTPRPSPAPVANAEAGAAADEHVRVSANLLKSLLNDADEISIARNRVEQTIADMQILMGDMEETLGRIESSMNSFEFHAKTRAGIRQGEQVLAKVQSTTPANGAGGEFDALELDKYTELQQIVLSLLEDYNDVMDLKSNVSGKLRTVAGILGDQQRSTNKLQEGLVSSQMVPFAGIAPRLRRLVRQVSADLDKQVTINFGNPEGKIDRSVLQALVNPIEHMIRNAIDHGIESTMERLAAGKQGQGELLVKLFRQGANIMLEIADDGRGINTTKVRQKAIAQGLLGENDKITEQELCQFILRAGFSTSDTVSHISGRGVGLDVVQDEITQIGGDIEIISRPGLGTTFRIRLPLTSSLNRALLFGVREASYAMLLNTIDGIILEKNDTLQRYYGEGKPASVKYGEKSYELAYLGALLDEHAVPEFLGGNSGSSSLVLVSGNGKNIALHVDSVIGSRELVVKSLGAQFATIPVLTGGVILGDGRVVVVLDPRFLVDSHVTKVLIPTAQVQTNTSEVAEVEFESGKTIMVVDDSITVRKVTSAMLKRNGMNVILAKNGLEAVELLQTTRPDVMLLDIEMPKMDGFEVAAYVRRQENQIKDLPIIMITSRIGDKHRARAEEIGVNQYMCKPFQEVNLLEAIAGYN
ncbi:MAG: response regulator [Pseudomonadota bacterium]